MRSGAAIVATVLAVLSVAGAPLAAAGGPHTITLTFIRHAQSAGNASGLIDTSTPGPGLTELGREQAAAAAAHLSGNDYDGIFASTMVRTQQTAQPMSAALGEPVTVLPGLREIEAGEYEGRPEADAVDYFSAPQRWLAGDRSARIPGSLSGDEFDARFDDAVRRIYDSGARDPVAFSHGAAIMLWVTMNVANPDPSLLRSEPLQNTGRVVLSGSPEQGWTLDDWRGAPA
ncbi:histidine phosphatase family protein [Mycobacterium sp. NPDC050551]|uniref:histidine phosphatase family protein n=1 Tax=Mycobacterium sp. NPDC050551 TaxID=3155407 RepID=UPI00342AD8E9